AAATSSPALPLRPARPASPLEESVPWGSRLRGRPLAQAEGSALGRWSGEGTAARSGNPADGAGSFGAASAQRGSAGAVAAGSFRGALLLSPQIELYSPGGDRYTPPEPGAPDWVPGLRTARRGITPGDRQLELTGEMELGVSKVLIIGRSEERRVGRGVG